jgi:hypothetical protein
VFSSFVLLQKKRKIKTVKNLQRDFSKISRLPTNRAARFFYAVGFLCTAYAIREHGLVIEIFLMFYAQFFQCRELVVHN